jgi:two-component system repressor protein LuxO
MPAQAGIHCNASAMTSPANRVLAIEHSPARLQAMEATLEAAGYRVRRVSPEDALAAARDSAPDAILADAAGDPVALLERMTQPVQPLALMERRMIEAALRPTNHDVPRAAALLEVTPSTVYRKLQAWKAEQA